MYSRSQFLGGLAVVSTTLGFGAAHATPVTTQSPFACDRLALTPAERHRHFDELGPFLRTKVDVIRAEPDGYSFRFPNDGKTFSSLTEWMNGERRCCPFFDFSLNVAREHGEVWMKLSGRPGTKEFIRSDFTPWFERAVARK
jgi:hypothetical protein